MENNQFKKIKIKIITIIIVILTLTTTRTNEIENNGKISEVPSKVTNVTEIDSTSTTIIIEWEEPNNGGLPITNYVVGYASTETEIWNYDNTSDTELVYIIQNLLSGSYYIKVAAQNSDGQGNFSDPITGSTKDPVPPDVIQNIYAIDTKPTKITIQWIKPASNGGANITSYRIAFKMDSQENFTNIIETNSTATNITLDGLNTSTTYDVKIQSYNKAGWSEYSSVFAFQTLEPTIPDKISPPPWQTGSSPTTIAVEWGRPYDEGSEITGYILAWKPESGSNWQTQFISTNSSFNPKTVNYTLTGLLSGNYQVQVLAQNAIGEGPNSDISTLNTSSPEVPDAPYNLALLNSTASSIDFNWSQPNNNGREIESYKIQFRPFTNSGSSGEVVVQNISLEYLLENIYSDNYTIQIAAINSVGQGPFGSANMSTQQPQVPSKVVNVERLNATPTSMFLQWPVPECNGRPISCFLLFATPIDNQSDIIVFNITDFTNETTTINFNASHLLSGIYLVEVFAVNQIGNGTISSRYVFNTKSPTVPAQVTNVSCNPANRTSVSILVSWDVPNDGGKLITNFLLNYSNSSDSSDSHLISTNIDEYSNPQFNLSNLLSWNYTISLKAINEIGESENWSIPLICATSQPQVPFQIENLTQTLKKRTEMNISWIEPCNGGANITNYTVHISNSQGENRTFCLYSCALHIDQLNVSTEYTIQVQACNSIGCSEPIQANFSTHSLQPDVVEGVLCSGSTRNSLTISWDLLDDSEVIGYSIQENNSIFNSSGNQSSIYTIYDLLPYTNYSIQLSAYTPFAQGNWSIPTYCITNASFPSIVTNVSIIETSYYYLKIQWEIPRDNGKKIDYYQINYTQCDSNSSQTLSVNQNIATISNLDPKTCYKIIICAHNIFGFGLWSLPVNSTTTKKTTSIKSYEGLIIGLTSCGVALIVAIVFFWIKRRKELKMTPTISIFSVESDEEIQNIDEVIMDNTAERIDEPDENSKLINSQPNEKHDDEISKWINSKSNQKEDDEITKLIDSLTNDNF